MGKPGWNKACQCGSIACALTLDLVSGSWVRASASPQTRSLPLPVKNGEREQTEDVAQLITHHRNGLQRPALAATV